MLKVFLLCGTDGQKENGEGVHPIRRLMKGAEGLLQAPVEAFHHSIGLGVVSGGPMAACAEKKEELAPGPGLELSALISDDCDWRSKLCHPTGEERRRRRFRRAVRHGDRRAPTGNSVNTGEEVTVAPGGRQRTHDVNVNGVEALRRHRDGVMWRSSVAEHLRSLTGKAVAGPLLDVTPHARPHRTPADESMGTEDARVVKGVVVFKHLSPVARRNVRARDAARHVAPQLGRRVWYILLHQLEGRGAPS